jgi:uncharacterized protein YndB with AHSA1/START domain
MADIMHRVEIHEPPERVYAAVTEEEGLKSWWTGMVEARPELGSIAKFRFGDGQHGPDMEVTQLDAGRKAVWTCRGGVDDWVGTEFTFDIQPTENGSVLRFKNSGWAEASDFYAHCNCKWGFFLGVSLKNYLETGKGRPAPDDPDI